MNVRMDAPARGFLSPLQLLKMAVVCLAYLTAGRIGLSVPFTSGNVSPMWPASGIALAAVVVWGYSMWPGIALGAFLTNFLSPIPAQAAMGIAVGNASSALVGGYLLRRLTAFRPSLTRLRDVLALILVGGVASTPVAAIGGTTTLFLTHVRPWSDFATAFRVWWFGDTMGVLVIAPLLLTGRELWRRRRLGRALELGCVLLGAAAGSMVIFSRSMGFSARDDVLAFVVFPFVIWAAIRFRAAGASAACMLVAAIAIWGTARGNGPFIQHSPVQNAILLQLFLAVITVSGLLLAAVISERSAAEHALRNLSGKLLRLQDAERRRFARELHDSTGQNLAALQMNLETVRQQLTAQDPKSSEALVQSQRLAGDIASQIRTLSYLLHPPLLDDSGLDSALQWYVDGLKQRSGLRIELDCSAQLGRFPQDVETALFRIVQECLTNIHRHSGSPTASIALARRRGFVWLTVRDTGKGIPAQLLEKSGDDRPTHGVGIGGMRERVRELGGSFRIGPGYPGTVVEVILPLARSSAKRPAAEAEDFLTSAQGNNTEAWESS